MAVSKIIQCKAKTCIKNDTVQGDFGITVKINYADAYIKNDTVPLYQK